MQTIKFFRLCILVILFSGISLSYAQQKTADEVKMIVESQNFVFNAEVANPARGGTRQLSAGYDLTVTKSKIVAYLPFFGRAQTLPVDAAGGGIRFTSTNFEYKVVPNRKGWLITITIKDVSNVQQLYLTVYDNGKAGLDVMNIHRDDISFRGYIKKPL
ncbi:MAG: DUF4251 domain-containing protein [Chitinophagaceae bacterium]|nr:DUF4251 domain-containing protein [Chitinophagaceae bacterium]